MSITRRAVFHPGRCHFARLTSGKSRYVPIRPRYERICTQKHTARQSACSQNDLDRPQWRALRAATAVVVGKLLMELRARVRTNKESENISQWQCDLSNTIPQWDRTPKSKTFVDRILAFDSTEESCSLDHVATAKCSQISYWSAPSPAILLAVWDFSRVIEKRRCTPILTNGYPLINGTVSCGDILTAFGAVTGTAIEG